MFNPYADRCPVYDYANASQLRRRMLREILAVAVESEVDSLWIGRELGHRGGRRSGLALTDDVYLHRHGERWGVATTRLTKGKTIKEQTAAVVWQVLSKIEDGVFLWNVFPLHPHQAGNPLSNRKFNADERKVGEEVLGELIEMLNPKKLVSLGNDAAVVVGRHCADWEHVKVRHPSHGGKERFLREVRLIYRCYPEKV